MRVCNLLLSTQPGLLWWFKGSAGSFLERRVGWGLKFIKRTTYQDLLLKWTAQTAHSAVPLPLLVRKHCSVQSWVLMDGSLTAALKGRLGLGVGRTVKRLSFKEQLPPCSFPSQTFLLAPRVSPSSAGRLGNLGRDSCVGQAGLGQLWGLFSQPFRLRHSAVSHGSSSRNSPTCLFWLEILPCSL